MDNPPNGDLDMTAEHNHPPACCCQNNQDHPEQIDGLVTCPACPHHGEFARITPILCPQCKAEIGQPHTDYCTLAPGRVWDGVLGQRVVAGGPRYDPPNDEALCGFRSLGSPDQRCTYPPHRPSTRHSWEAAGGRMTEDGPICSRCLQPDGHHYIDGTCPKR